MADLNIHNKALYIGVLMGSGFLVFAALGPGLLNSSFQESIGSWQYRIFDLLCHQDSARSYWLSGVQMAVCARCLGIYGLFFIGWLLLPVLGILSSGSSLKERNWLIVVIILNLVDVTGNYFDVWTNSLSSRLALGGLLGISVALLLANEFFNLNKSE